MMRLRQMALVAGELDPVVDALCDVLGLEVCFNDPGVGKFGLHNALFAIGDTFLEVVSPVEEGTTAGRLLEKRNGDGGYMVIVQVDDMIKEKTRVEGLGVRVVWTSDNPEAMGTHFHPRDVGGAILSFDQMTPPESWKWAGPEWEDHVKLDVSTEIIGCELQANDPAAMAQKWAEVFAKEREDAGDGSYRISIDGGSIRFVSVSDGRGEGVSGITLRSVNPRHSLDRAKALGLTTRDDAVEICGTWFTLKS